MNTLRGLRFSQPRGDQQGGKDPVVGRSSPLPARLQRGSHFTRVP